MIIVCQRLLKNTKINAITLFPFILLKNQKGRGDRVLMNHEKIHFRQQLEMIVVPFYIWYVIEYWVHWFRLKDAYKAYRAISFEKEAYAQEFNFSYLKQRKFWQFIQYL